MAKFLLITILLLGIINIEFINCESCEDKNVNCIERAKSGECKQNMTSMQNICPRSCGLCLLRAHERVVKDFLFQHYDKTVRPKITVNKTVDLQVQFYLMDIISVDDKSKSAELLILIALNWTDDHLSWEPLNFGNVSSLHLPDELIWKPDMTLYNGANAKQLLMTDMCGITNILLTNDGGILWVPACNVKVFFNEKSEIFPYDEITIVIKLGSWMHDSSSLSLSISELKTHLSFYRENSDWKVKKATLEKNSIIYSCCPEPYEDITFNVICQRRSHFYGLTLVLTNVLSAFILIFALVISPEKKIRVHVLCLNMVIITLHLLFLIYYIPSFKIIPTIVKCAATVAVFNMSAVGLCALCYNLVRKTNTSNIPGYVQKITKLEKIVFCSKNISYPEDCASHSIYDARSTSDLIDDKSLAGKEIELNNRKQWFTLAKILNNLFLFLFIFILVVIIIALIS